MEQFGILSFGSRLKRLSDYLYGEVQAVYAFESLAISSTCFPILRLLQSEEDLSVVEISERLGLSHPAVSKQVSKMLKEGLVTKLVDERDLRRFVIRLSPLCQQEMLKLEPVLEAIGAELQYQLSQVSGDFLSQLTDLEQALLKGGYTQRVLLRLHPEKRSIHPLQPHQIEDFRRLNMAWLERYFADQIDPQDIATLSAPFDEIEKQGSIVKVALFNDQVIGTYLLRRHEHAEMELCKLCVDEKYMRLGVGEMLVQDAIEESCKAGFERLTLESHTCLVAALNLYGKLEFHVQYDASSYSVARANIKLELDLRKHHDA